MDPRDWLRSLGLEEYEVTFRENQINEKVLPSLTAEDLKDLGVILVGDRRRLSVAMACDPCRSQRLLLRTLDPQPSRRPNAGRSRSCSATWSAQPRLPRDSIPRTCVRSSVHTVAAVPISSRRPAVS